MAKSTIVIKAPVERVFEYVADLTRHGEWSTHTLLIESVEAGRTGVGARYLSHGAQIGRKVEDTLTVTEYEPNRRFAFESVGPGGTWHHTYHFEAAGAATSVTRLMEPAHLPTVLKVIRPLIGIGLRRNQKGLEKLRDRLEA